MMATPQKLSFLLCAICMLVQFWGGFALVGSEPRQDCVEGVLKADDCVFFFSTEAKPEDRPRITRVRLSVARKLTLEEIEAAFCALSRDLPSLRINSFTIHIYYQITMEEFVRLDGGSIPHYASFWWWDRSPNRARLLVDRDAEADPLPKQIDLSFDLITECR
ncbi:MAG TPA: hypothetical protein VLV83_16570 [Acidobacteriota bacterium]|nr:hypothetical protein [Acidobacteriota bacterium]